MMAARLSRPSEMTLGGEHRTASDGEDLRPCHGLLLEGVIARMADHPDGRSAISELYVAPAVLSPGPDGERWMAIGVARFRPFTVLGAEQVARADRLAAEQAELRRAWLEILLFETARARIAYLLLALATASARSGLGPVNLSYARIAGLSGVTERSVDRAMAPWLKEGVLTRTRDGYVVREIEALREALGEGREALDFVSSRDRRRAMIGRLSAGPTRGDGLEFGAERGEPEVQSSGEQRQGRNRRRVQESQGRTHRQRAEDDRPFSLR